MAAASWAQQQPGSVPEQKSETPGDPHHTPVERRGLRRLEAVTWNPITHELSWVVSAGSRVEGAYQPAAKETYVIDPESATMKVNGERRRFSDVEAENVHALMDSLVRYAAESTVWWEHGLGEKLDDRAIPIPGQKETDKKKPHPTVRTSDIPIAEIQGHAKPVLASETKVAHLGF